MAEEWRNPWAPSDDSIPDDDSLESSISLSKPIEPGQVVQTAPHNVFVSPAAEQTENVDEAPTGLVKPPLVQAETVRVPNPADNADSSFFAPPAPIATDVQAPPATMPTEVIGQSTTREPAPTASIHTTGDVGISSSITNTVDREDLDRTVMSRNTSQMWALRWASGQSALFSIGPVVVGRNPTAHAGHVGAQLVQLEDSTRTVSKSHALFEYSAGVWYVTDLQSTNGVILVSESGLHTDAVPGQRVQATPHLMLGDLDVRLVQVDV